MLVVLPLLEKLLRAPIRIMLIFSKKYDCVSLLSDYTVAKTFEARRAPVQKRYNPDYIRARGARNFVLLVSREAILGHL